MADETRKGRKGRRLGPLRLGKRCKYPRELGSVHEARNVRTGAPALVMTPGPRPIWKPGRRWQVRAYAQVSPPFVALEVEQAPPQGAWPELAEVLGVLSSCAGLVEHDNGLNAHLTRSPKGWLTRWTGRVRHALRSLAQPALVALTVLALGGGFWLGSGTRTTDSTGPEHLPADVGMAAIDELEAPVLIDNDLPGAIAYPLPAKPFRDQARGPCRTERDEVEINGGCWLELAKRPPCHKDFAEYRGRCYAPVSKDRGPRPPQALQP